MKNLHKKVNSRKGFTLIEILVVIFVLGIGLIGALSFFNINLNNQFEAKNELIAAGLAQEGTELVRNIRDYNILNLGAPNNPNWWSWLYWPIFSTSFCKHIDYNALDPYYSLFTPAQKCQALLVVDDLYYVNGRYVQQRAISPYPASSKTIFSRTIDIEEKGGTLGEDEGAYLEVTCIISWNGRETKAVDILYDNSF